VLFVSPMSKTRIVIYGGLLIVLLIAWMFTRTERSDDNFPERVKIAMREVGNQLLLMNGDSTSLVLPVIARKDSLFELSFERNITFPPGTLVRTVDTVFRKAGLPKHYIAQVIQCSNEEVGYSYEKTARNENTIIPCSSRVLPDSCYTIEFQFINKNKMFELGPIFPYLLLLLAAVFLLDLVVQKRKQNILIEEAAGTIELGIFKFYPEQNKLVKEAAEINLSRKECELLEIFVANPNKIIKRDELTKKVWEDNGVIVGRSLDTYISKLRKKLKEDESIKLTNVHGVGYKLEVG
jgi:hypothetical protein